MEIRTFTEDEIILNRLVLRTPGNNSPGLLTGRMGAVIAVAHYAQKKNSEALDSIADAMLDNIIKNLPYLRDLSFASGLCGIIWGVEYLVQSGLMPGPADDICKEADKIIGELDIPTIKDHSLETGLAGIWECLWARIQGNIEAGLPLPYTSDFLEKWLPILKDKPEEFAINSSRRLEVAMTGKLISKALDIKGLIRTKKTEDNDDLSLTDGCAGKLLNIALN